MPKQKLFDEESEEEVIIKTENEYAKKYDKWREKEELHKLEQKYGSKDLNSEASLSTDSEDESDEPLEVSEEIETKFLKTLAMLKTKDPRIYDPNFNCFNEKEKREKVEKLKVKTLTFEDSDDDEDSNDGNIFKIEKKAPEIGYTETETFDEKSTKQTPKETKVKEFLTGKAEHIDDEVEKDLAPLKALWSDPKLNEGEAFLRDYILNKRYLEEGDAGEAEEKIRDDEDLEADEMLVEEQGKFERAYNFRFEEPDEEYLKRFPRTMNYIRPKDDRRSRKRAEVRTRKEEEKKRKMEEIARLKAFKLKEIQEKIAKIKEVTGNEDLAFKEEDIEGDFDPEEHDQRMRALFDEQYYGEVDHEKPVFPDLDEELEIENWENYENENDVVNQNNDADGPHCEDDEFNMDADYDPKKVRANLLEELKQNMGKKRRNRKKKSKLAELLSSDKPKFVPTVADKTYSEYMEEYYKMDCEDIVGGDLPTRFKYREVVPNDYGLSIEEILLADDKELTQWVPLKKIVKHRPADVEKGEIKTYAKKAADVNLKKKMLPSLFKGLPEEPEIVVSIEETTKRKKKKKKKQNSKEASEAKEENNQLENNNTSNEKIVNNMAVSEGTSEKTKKKRKKRKRDEDNNVQNENYTTDNAIKNDIKTVGDKIENNLEVNNLNKEFNVSKKKKKKRKRDEDNNVQSEKCTTDNAIENNDIETVGDKIENNLEVNDLNKEFNVSKKKKKKRKTDEDNNVQNEKCTTDNAIENNDIETVGDKIENNLQVNDLNKEFNVSKKKKKKRKTDEDNNVQNEKCTTDNAIENNDIETVDSKMENNLEVENDLNKEFNVSKKKKKKNNAKFEIKEGEVIKRDNILDHSIETNGDLTAEPIESNQHDIEVKSRKKKKKGKFVVEDTHQEVPSRISDDPKDFDNKSEKLNMKRKLEFSEDNHNVKKKKKNKKIKINANSVANSTNAPKKDFKKNKFRDDNANPLVKLSDERLKAYGLNPKKYKKFMKYKKF